MTGNSSVAASGSEGERVRCSIVIRAYNEEKHIGRLLTGILKQTVQDVEVILVDSGSTDATVMIAAAISSAHPERRPVKVVHIHPDEFTFGRSLNLGIAEAQGEFIVIASAHVHPVYPDWLERLLAPFSDPQVALTYGKQRGPSDAKFSEHQIFARWFSNHSTLRQSHPFCNNANAAIRRSLWEERPYDETLSGLEDLDWAHWATENGHVIAYVAEAEIIHTHDETPRAVFNRYRREAMAFKHIFPQEKFSLWDLLRLVITNIASDLWAASHQRVLLKTMGSILWFRWMQFWGTYQGYRHAGPLTWQLRKTFYYPLGVNAPLKDPSRNVQPIQYHDIPEKS